VPEDLQTLDKQLSDTYFCVFQAIPNGWAVK
jgi:arginine decarboxylase-like protein